MLASEALLCENKKFQRQNVTSVSIEPLDISLQVQHPPFLVFACKTETLGSLYSHVLFKLNYSSPKIKWCINRSLKISYAAHAKLVQKGGCWTCNEMSSGSILTGVTFCYWNFLFSQSKASDASIGIIAILAHYC